jgi:polyketide cyclase/dehydrase/lipid transport protein
MSWQFEHSADSDAGPDEIWRRYVDVEHWSDWSPGVEWSRLDGPFEVGAKGKSKPPGSPTLRFRVVAVEPRVMFATRVRFPGAGLLFEHAIEPLATGARITHRATLTGPLASLYAPSVRRRTEQGLTDSVERLASVAGTPLQRTEARGP